MPRRNSKQNRDDWAALVKAARRYAQAVVQKVPPEPAAVRPPHAFAYGRCSHESSAESGLGLESQTEMCRAYFRLLQAKHPEVQWGGMQTDAAVSAYKKRLLERKGGAELNASLRPGDHVIFARLDRGFRNLKDLLNTFDQWIARDIHIHFCDLGLDLTTDFGRLILQILGAVAEWQARYTSARNMEISKVMRSLGRKGNGRAPMGFKLVGPKGKRRKVVKDEAALAVMQEIVRLRDGERLSWMEISDRIEQQLAHAEGRQPIPAFDQGKRQWTKHKCQMGYEAALALARHATARAEAPDTPA